MNFRVPPGLVRLAARQLSRRVLNPRLPWELQRRRPGRPRTRSDGTGHAAGSATGSAVVTVVHFHGGGYCAGSPAQAQDWAAYLTTRTGCRVVLPEYRLAPEHPIPPPWMTLAWL